MNNQSFDIGRALTFMFEEEDWVMKFLIAVGMTLVAVFIVPAIILQGYVIEIVRRVGRDEQPALPTWDNWSLYLADGAKALGALIAYMSPIFLLSCCMIVPLTAMADESGDLSGPATLLLCCFMFVIIAIQIPLFVLYFAGMAEYAATKDFGAFFRFSRLWADIRLNSTLYLYAMGVIFIANFVGSFVPFVGFAWTQLVTGHALGQYLRHLKRGETPAPPAPPHSTVI